MLLLSFAFVLNSWRYSRDWITLRVLSQVSVTPKQIIFPKAKCSLPGKAIWSNSWSWSECMTFQWPVVTIRIEVEEMLQLYSFIQEDACEHESCRLVVCEETVHSHPQKCCQLKMMLTTINENRDRKMKRQFISSLMQALFISWHTNVRKKTKKHQSSHFRSILMIIITKHNYIY